MRISCMSMCVINYCKNNEKQKAHCKYLYKHRHVTVLVICDWILKVTDFLKILVPHFHCVLCSISWVVLDFVSPSMHHLPSHLLKFTYLLQFYLDLYLYHAPPLHHLNHALIHCPIQSNSINLQYKYISHH